MARDFRKEYKEYHSRPDQKLNRAARNKARKQAERAGKVRKGDGKDIDHKDHNPKNSSSSNLRVRSRSSNRADNLGRGGRPRKK